MACQRQELLPQVDRRWTNEVAKLEGLTLNNKQQRPNRQMVPAVLIFESQFLHFSPAGKLVAKQNYHPVEH